MKLGFNKSNFQTTAREVPGTWGPEAMPAQKLALSPQPPLIPTEPLGGVGAGFGQQKCAWGACEQVVQECQCEQAEVTPGRGTDMASTHMMLFFRVQ